MQNNAKVTGSQGEQWRLQQNLQPTLHGKKNTENTEQKLVERDSR